MLTQSVAVVSKIVDAVAGSVPSRRSTTGTTTPEIPLKRQADVIEIAKQLQKKAGGKRALPILTG